MNNTVFNLGSMVLDLRKCNEGMSCEEFTTLMVAGLPDMPPAVRRRLDEHARACSYHRSRAFYQSALGTPVTELIEQGARDIIQKYSEKEEQQ